MRQRRADGRDADRPALTAWQLPLIVAVLAVTIVAGFYVGGPGLGLAVGALAAATIVVMAVRHPPLYPIVPAPLADFRRHVLVVVSAPLEDSAAIDPGRAGGADRGWRGDRGGGPRPQPARIGFLDRWSSDFRRASQRAQRRLVVSLASLAKADVAATARVGDENLIHAVDDTLRSFPATEVILVTGSPESDPAGNAAVPVPGLEAGQLRLRVELGEQAGGDAAVQSAVAEGAGEAALAAQVPSGVAAHHSVAERKWAGPVQRMRGRPTSSWLSPTSEWRVLAPLGRNWRSASLPTPSRT